MRRTQIIPTRKILTGGRPNAPQLVRPTPLRKTHDAQENPLGRGHYTTDIREMWRASLRQSNPLNKMVRN